MKRKIYTRSNRAQSNWKKIERNVAEKLMIKDQDSIEPYDGDSDQPVLKNNRGSWMCNGIRIPGNQISVVYSEQNSLPWSKNPPTGGKPQTGFINPENLYYPKTDQKLSVQELLEMELASMLTSVRTPQKLAPKTVDGTLYQRSVESGGLMNSESTAYQLGSLVRDFLNLIIKKVATSSTKDDVSGNGDVRRSEEADVGEFLRYIQPSISVAFSNNQDAEIENAISFLIENLPKLSQAVVDTVEPVKKQAELNSDSFGSLGLIARIITQPMQTLIKPLEAIIHFSNPFKRMIEQREGYRPIYSSTQSHQLYSDLTNLIKSNISEQDFTQQDNNLLLKTIRTILDLLELLKQSTSRQGTLQSTVDDQTNPGLRPISDSSNLSESYDTRQDFPSLPLDDLTDPLLAIFNFMRSLMYPKSSERMDSEINNSNPSLSLLQSLILKLNPFDIFGDQSVLIDPSKYLKSVNSGNNFGRGVARSRRETRETDNCPTIPSDYYQTTGSPNAYKLYTNDMNWNDAQLNCKSEAAKLASPKNRAQYDIMIGYAKRTMNNSDASFHVGFHRLFTSEKWTTVCGRYYDFT